MDTVVVDALPHLARRGPYAVAVEAGKTYYHCACGLSANQPFCDGSHKNGTSFQPNVFTATETKTVYLCGCKRSKTGAFCDGTHKALPA